MLAMPLYRSYTLLVKDELVCFPVTGVCIWEQETMHPRSLGLKADCLDDGSNGNKMSGSYVL
jgi:hypothetical protein